MPRVWEKIEEKLKELGKNNSGIKKIVMDWAKNAALQHHTDKMAGKEGKLFFFFKIVLLFSFTNSVKSTFLKKF